MFTGIVEQIGRVERVSENHFWVSHHYDEDFFIGESIALSGMCSTVLEMSPSVPLNQEIQGEYDFCGKFLVEIMSESRGKTIFGKHEIGENFSVNLERAARMNQRNSGHMVQGHVDGLGEIIERRREGDYELFCIKYPKQFRNLLIMKGSVAVDGISLTVSGLDDPESDVAFFEISIISHTLAVTTLGTKKLGDFCHLEFDMAGKYKVRKDTLEKFDNNFEKWNPIKQKLHVSTRAPFFREGEIRWVFFGQNIASEVFGKGKLFRRPAVIIKKVFGNSAVVVPLSSQLGKKGSYFFEFIDSSGKGQLALLPQIRYVDGRRIGEKLSVISGEDLAEMKRKVGELL